MSRIWGMPGLVPTVVLLLWLLTDCGKGDEATKPIVNNRTLFSGLSGRWGENSVVGEVWGIRGSSVLLRCNFPNLDNLLKADSNVSWVKDDEVIFNRRSFVLSDGGLNITKLIRRRGRLASETDGGEYRCIIRLTRGLPWKITGPPVHLRIADLGRQVDVSPRNVSVSVGESLRFSCQIHSDPPASYSWGRVGGELPQDGRFSQLNINSGVLQIINIQTHDAGSYKCWASNEVLNKTRESDVVHISVEGDANQSSFIPPTFLSPTPNAPVKVVEGHGATLECLTNGLPQPSISWHRKFNSEGTFHRVPVTEMEGKVSFSSLGNLHLQEVSLGDGGMYACTATALNPVTGKQSSITQESILQVISAPSIVKPLNNVTTLIAKTVRLNCSLPDDTDPSSPLSLISWYKNGFSVATDTRVQVTQHNQLIFVNSITKDTGVYQCLALNEAGFATSWSYLFVNSSQDHPYPPQNLRHFLLSPTSVLLEWDVVETGASNPIQAYSIHFTELGEKPSEFQFVSQSNSYLLKHLKPHTDYSFFVRAYNTEASDPSKTLIFRTGEDVPLDVPEFDVQPTSHTSLLVSWSPLDPLKARGSVTGYKVQWQRRSKDYYNLNEVGPDVFHLELMGLHPGKTYKVRVLAKTKAGYNEASDWPWKAASLPTTSDLPYGNVPLAVAAAVHIIDSPSQNATSINVTWQRPSHDTSPLDGYVIKYKKQNGPWSDDIIIPVSASSYVIDDLSPDWYKVKIHGFNKKGNGLSSIEMIQTGINLNQNLSTEDSPVINKAVEAQLQGEANEMPSVQEVNVTPESETIVHLSWKVRNERSGEVVFYTVKRKLTFGTGDKEPVFTRSTANSIVVDGLTPFNVYEFSVRAHISETEFGLYSPPVETTTISSLPTAPSKLEYVPLDASTVELTWSTVKISNDTPVIYQIIYAINKSLPLNDWMREEVTERSSKITGLVANTQYWFRVRGCSETNCGAYSEPFPACISAILPPTANAPHLYIIIGLIGILVVLILFAFLAIYIIKLRHLEGAAPGAVSHGADEGGKVPKGECLQGPLPLLARKGDAVDVSAGDGDYIPMLNRIHPDVSSAVPLDAKGDYMGGRVNGFRNLRCNSLVHARELHYRVPSKKGDCVSDECQCLFVPPGGITFNSFENPRVSMDGKRGPLHRSLSNNNTSDPVIAMRPWAPTHF